MFNKFTFFFFSIKAQFHIFYTIYLDNSDTLKLKSNNTQIKLMRCQKSDKFLFLTDNRYGTSNIIEKRWTPKYSMKLRV